MDVRFFRSAAHFRRWLSAHHARAPEVWVGFYRKGRGPAGLTYPEAVDEALCYGWIDGVRKKVDEDSYTNRFSRRTARSIWSHINLRRFEALRAEGRIASPGLVAFEARDPKRSGLYSFENRPRTLGAAHERTFKANPPAWTFFRAQAPGYQRVTIWWILSAAKEETRQRRLQKLIAESARGRRLDELVSPSRKKTAAR